MSKADAASDRVAIVQLTIDYCWALDTKSWGELERIFTPDAIADLGADGQNGLAEIVERVSSALGPLDDSQHMVSNHQIQLDGDRATGRCYLQAQHVRHKTENGDLYTVGGRYEDDYQRTPDGWRIVKRRIVPMWTEGNRRVFDAARG